MKTKELADWLGVSTGSIRQWTIADEFKPFLSPAAQGGDGTTRHFDEQDARIMAYIKAMRDESASTDDIVASLARMQAEGWRDLPPMPAVPPGIQTLPVVLEREAQTMLSQQRAHYVREIQYREERIDILEDELDTERAAHSETRRELMTIKQQAGRLEGELHATAQVRQVLMRVLMAVTVAAGILLAVVVLLALTGGPA